MQTDGNVLRMQAKPLLHGMDLNTTVLASEYYVETSLVIS
jgi:hypothetical protein